MIAILSPSKSCREHRMRSRKSMLKYLHKIVGHNADDFGIQKSTRAVSI